MNRKIKRSRLSKRKALRRGNLEPSSVAVMATGLMLRYPTGYRTGVYTSRNIK
jgi:hypothetical protein